MIGYRNFPREIQFTNHTCGPCSAFAIALFFSVGAEYAEVKEELRTNVDGTSNNNIIKFLRSRDLRVSPRSRMTWRELQLALTDGCVVVVDLDGDHCGVVHGADDKNVYLMDPSLRRMIGRRLPISEFMERWDRGGISVRRRGKSARRRTRAKKGRTRLS